MKKGSTKCFCTILHKLFSYASARDSASKQKQEKFFTVWRLIKAFKITFLSLLPQKKPCVIV